ncbi:MAG: hypothetical protein IT291_09090 [Deltaproteobacteria bacterium]|nr:hypothetical protein [Deltaproteobacteria bacterium]
MNEKLWDLAVNIWTDPVNDMTGFGAVVTESATKLPKVATTLSGVIDDALSKFNGLAKVFKGVDWQHRPVIDGTLSSRALLKEVPYEKAEEFAKLLMNETGFGPLKVIPGNAPEHYLAKIAHSVNGMNTYVSASPKQWTKIVFETPVNISSEAMENVQYVLECIPKALP